MVGISFARWRASSAALGRRPQEGVIRLDEASAGVIVKDDSVGVFVGGHWAFRSFSFSKIVPMDLAGAGRTAAGKKAQWDNPKKRKELRRGEGKSECRRKNTSYNRAEGDKDSGQ